MIDGWYLTKDVLLYMQDFSKGKITYIRLTKDEDEEEEECEVKYFQLPADI